MARIVPLLVLVTGLVSPARAGVLPELPDLTPLAALIERPSGDCNAADRFVEAEEIYRRGELQKPPKERMPLRADHPAMKLVLEGLECRRCEFPYSADLTIPPTEQTIPMSALYWAASGSLVERARELRREGKDEQASREYARVLQLGLLLLEEPGMTFIQQFIALRVLSQGAEGLGDLAITRGDEERAASCARFLARSHAYRDDMGVLMREVLAYRPLLEDPASQAAQVQKVAPLFDATTNEALQLEILVYLAMARVVVADPAAREAAEVTLQRARRSPDLRIRGLGEWGLGLRADEARQILRETMSWPDI